MLNTMKINKIFSVYLLLISLSAVLGGYNLIVNNGGGLPLEWLVNSPFSNYFWPGIILLFVVGGTHLIAAVTLWKNYFIAPSIASVAGCGLLIWIFTEVYMIEHTHWLQILYFGFGMVTLISSIVLLQYRRS